MDATLGSTAPGADPLQPTDNAVTPGVGAAYVARFLHTYWQLPVDPD
jgi:hypothetical protein